MAQLQLTVKTITPLLMFGADNKNPSIPELRAPSVRGLLRYWLRAVLGVKHNTGKALHEAESAILGSTEQGARVQVRVFAGSSLQDASGLRVMPERIPSDGFKDGGQFRITLTTHPLDNSDVFAEDGDLVKALYLLTHFGGMGKRSRRGSGNLRVLSANFEQLAFYPSEGESLVEHLRNVSHHITSQTTLLGRRPAHPVFAWDTAAVLVSPDAFPTYRDAFDELWDISGPYHYEGGIFGDVRPRRASSIHMRVSESQAGYHPQITVMYSGDRDNVQWSRMKSFIQTFRNNGFVHVYGDWSGWR